MRPLFRSGLPVGAAVLATVLAAAPARPATDAPSGDAARGAYVMRAADCQTCHTAEGGRPFAGGRPMQTPFGTLYTPNITPDAETGIGAWTEADFERALRQGRRKDDAFLYPAMPYTAYTQMSDRDVADLWAYMRSVEPVRNEAPENELAFPFDIRLGLAAWQEL